MMTFEDSADRLIALLDRAEPRFRARFLDAVRSIRSSRSLAELEDLIRGARFEDAIVLLEQEAMRISSTFSDVFVDAGEKAGRFVSTALGVAVIFDRVGGGAVASMQQNQQRLIQGFAEGQRDTARAVIAEGVRAGRTTRRIAQELRQTAGLTSRQIRAIENYRRLLETGSSDALRRVLRDRRFDETIRSAQREGRPLTQAQIDRMVDRYTARQLAHRAEVIARTEALRAVNEGTEELFAQAIAAGLLNPADLERIWVTVRDPRVRDSHVAMHLQVVQFGVAFVSGAGNLLQFPGDPSAPAEETVSCRCVVITRFTDSAIQVLSQTLA